MNNRLLELRKAKGVTGTELSKALFISNPYYYDLENGKKRLNEDILIKLSNYYNVSTDYILGLVDEHNVTLIKENDLPEELRGLVDEIGIIKDANKSGLSNEDIKEILEIAIKIRQKS